MLSETGFISFTLSANPRSKYGFGDGLKREKVKRDRIMKPISNINRSAQTTLINYLIARDVSYLHLDRQRVARWRIEHRDRSGMRDWGIPRQ